MHYYLESASSPQVRRNITRVLKQTGVTPGFTTLDAQLLELDGRYMSAYYFPLRDYQGEKNHDLPPAGFVLMWEDVTPLVNELHTSVWGNIVYAVIGFILIEIILIWMFNRELRLVVAEREASRDGLTGLYNRRYFDQVLPCELTTATRSGREVSLLVCDIDQFKPYNDHYGHQQGDMCLRRISVCLERNLGRNIDWVARYGGEEFVAVLPDTDLAGALHVGERLRHAVMELAIPHAHSMVAPVVTLSIGAASSAETADPKGLFECADKKLYRAKKNGSNRVEG
jgi:diguanylate cyclase (GGDEF)-like protein